MQNSRLLLGELISILAVQRNIRAKTMPRSIDPQAGADVDVLKFGCPCGRKCPLMANPVGACLTTGHGDSGGAFRWWRLDIHMSPLDQTRLGHSYNPPRDDCYHLPRARRARGNLEC